MKTIIWMFGKQGFLYKGYFIYQESTLCAVNLSTLQEFICWTEERAIEIINNRLPVIFNDCFGVTETPQGERLINA